MEINIIINNKALFELDGKELEEFESYNRDIFEQTEAGKAIINNNFQYIDRDFDDCQLILVYSNKL